MADEEKGGAPPVAPSMEGPGPLTDLPVVHDPEDGLQGVGGGPRAPGWYPDRANPNDQAYWDGQEWTARRRWNAGKGWLVVGDAPDAAMSNTSPRPTGFRLSGNPYAVAPHRKTGSTGFTFSLGLLLFMVSGIAMMYGSVGAWVHVQGRVGVAGFSVSLNGVDGAISTLIGVNGWVTFIGGILIVIFACFQMTSEELQLSILTAVVAAITTVFAVYDMFRMVQKINQVQAAPGADISVGWGLICVLSAAVLATLIAVVRLLQR